MGQRRGSEKQEGINVYVRVRASAAQDEGDSPRVGTIQRARVLAVHSFSVA